VFSAADKDKDGLLTQADMMVAHLKADMSEEDSKLAFKSLDTDGDGYVSVNQYFEANREFYLSEDPAARGNYLAGHL
jgi:Ca2+-binding EF-hand superfamily protein